MPPRVAQAVPAQRAAAVVAAAAGTSEGLARGYWPAAEAGAPRTRSGRGWPRPLDRLVVVQRARPVDVLVGAGGCSL